MEDCMLAILCNTFLRLHLKLVISNMKAIGNFSHIQDTKTILY